MGSQWPEMPWKTTLLLYLIALGFDICRLFDGPVYRFLMNFFNFRTSPSKKPIKGVQTSDIIIDKRRNLWFRLYTPVSASSTTSSSGCPVIFFIHGGGFTAFGPESRPYNVLCCRLARKLCAIVISINYRLAPEHRYPCQYEDGFDTLKFIDTSGVELLPSQANLNQCFMVGDSAGGNIVHNLTLKVSEYQFSRIKIIGNIMIQPFFGGEERTESELRLRKAPFLNISRTDWAWKAFLPEKCSRDHKAVNVFGPNSVDISGVKFPATIIFVGGYDPLQDWQKRYYEGLKKRGKEAYLVEYPNAGHVFYAFPKLPESDLLIEEVKYFVEKQISVFSRL